MLASYCLAYLCQRIILDWYSDYIDSWWVDCYVWYSVECWTGFLLPLSPNHTMLLIDVPKFNIATNLLRTIYSSLIIVIVAGGGNLCVTKESTQNMFSETTELDANIGVTPKYYAPSWRIRTECWMTCCSVRSLKIMFLTIHFWDIY